MPPDASSPEGEITRHLAAIQQGDPGAFDRLFALVYDELRGAAHRRLVFRHQGDTLSTTALVHETYLKLVAARVSGWRDRTHFFAAAEQAMRQILIDDARRRTAEKRGGGGAPAPLDEERIGLARHAEEILAVDEALARLAARDGRLRRIVVLRFYAGLSVEETAQALGLSPRTVKRGWRKARAFLHASLSTGGAGAAPPQVRASQ